MDRLLHLLCETPTLSTEELSLMLGSSKEEVEDKIKQYEKDGIICGTKILVNWDKVKKGGVTALIELKVIPQKETGFEKIAEEILNYDEVESLYLMAGAYDLAVFVKGESIQEISAFVSKRLATIESVTSTATHFLLKRYKELGINMSGEQETDSRSMVL